MASATQHRRAFLLAAVLLAASPVVMRGAAATAAGCGTAEKFPAGRSYANCTALGHLGATLYWTYDAKAATLSVAFVAKPPTDAGWVSWAINPTGDGMAGAQALLALRASAPAASPYVVRTYNVTGYSALPATSTPIAFKATELAADESGTTGKVRLYGKLQLTKDMKLVNYIWQVGSAVTNGAPAKHAFAKDNLDAKGKLALVAGAAAEPAPAPSTDSSSAEEAGSGPPATTSGKKSAATAATYVSAPVLAFMALVGFFMATV